MPRDKLLTRRILQAAEPVRLETGEIIKPGGWYLEARWQAYWDGEPFIDTCYHAANPGLVEREIARRAAQEGS